MAAGYTTYANMFRTVGGYPMKALSAAQQARYAGFKAPNKIGFGHCFRMVDYNPDTGLARYQFANGLRSYYRMLGPFHAQCWANAPSLGRWYNGNIRMRMGNTLLGRLFHKR